MKMVNFAILKINYINISKNRQQICKTLHMISVYLSPNRCLYICFKVIKYGWCCSYWFLVMLILNSNRQRSKSDTLGCVITWQTVTWVPRATIVGNSQRYLRNSIAVMTVKSWSLVPDLIQVHYILSVLNVEADKMSVIYLKGMLKSDLKYD